MKKKLLIVFALCLAIAAAAFAVWRCDRSNVPSQEEVISCLTEKGEEAAAKLLLGCSHEEICTAWGNPVMSLFGVRGEVWETDNAISITLRYDLEGNVTHVGFHAQAK